MNGLGWTSFIVLATVLVLVIQLLIINSVMAQAQNTSLTQNRSTIKIVDPKNRTITIVDTITNQPISVRNLTPAEAANTTTNDTIITNATSSEILTPEKTTINETLTTNAGNTTTNENLTDEFDEIQGK
jgi:hypothetical protein